MVGEAAQEALAAELSALVLTELDALDELRTTAATAAGVIRPGAMLDAAKRGKETMDAIRRTIARLEGVEQAEQQARLEDRRRLDRLVTAATVGAGAIGVLAGIGLAFVVAAEMLGYGPGDLLGADLHATTHYHRSDGSPYPREQCPIVGASASGKPVRMGAECFWRRDGSPVAVEYSVRPLADDGGGSHGAVVTVVEVSDPGGGDDGDEQAAAELREAIARGELAAHYQPKVELATGRLVGAEALVRWMRPQGAPVFPDHFVPLAERTGVIHDLTRFMLSEAVRQHAAWAAGGLVVPMAVNLSAEVLSDRQLPEFIEAVCQREGVPPRVVELEVTETAAMADPAASLVILGELVERGFPLALDDFGTGLSSLAHLRRLPVEVVKIDRSFVANLPDDPADAHIARGTIDLAHGLGKRVVAEGVETADALDYLLLVGCDAGQGYHWSRPLPAEEFVAWASQWEKRGAGASLGLPVIPMPEREEERIEALRRYRVLDTACERVFDEIAAAAAAACGTPMSAITLVDRNRQWFKAQRGLGCVRRPATWPFARTPSSTRPT